LHSGTPPCPRDLPWPGRCAVVGVLNVTPDSFSDGGRFSDAAAAVAHGRRLATEGADLIDVGGESTRPGAGRVSADVELERVRPVVAALVAANVPVSIDTTRADVAAACLREGARVVNDVSGGLADPGMAAVVAEAGATWILMHWRGHSRGMQQRADYGDVVVDVRTELSRRVDAALAAGVDERSIVLDPGLGFAKRAEHNLALLDRLDEITALGLPVLVGASRKSFLGTVLAEPSGQLRPVEGRECGTLATTVIAATAGAWGVRVHDVACSVDALRVFEAVHGKRRQPLHGAGGSVREKGSS